MTTGRTHLRFTRVYIDGYDMSGYSRSFGPLACTFDEGIDDSVDKTIKGVLPGSANITMGTLSGLFDNTATSGLHVIANAAGVARYVMIPFGISAAPENNDPVFSGIFLQKGYTGNPDENPVNAGLEFGGQEVTATHLSYARPWGVLLHAKAARTAANTATGLDQTASSVLGGWMQYHVFSGDGTAALKVQHASTNSDGSFGDLLSSGTVDCSSPTKGIATLAKTATVNRYVRWQLTLGTATTVTFAISFHRGV